MSFLHNETDHGHCCFQFDSIEQFQFSYLTGNDINGRVVYAIKLQSGFYHVMIQLNHRLKEESDYFLVDELFLQYLLSILKDNQVDQWDGFNEMDNTAMDGCDFCLSVSNESGRIFALGYESWPENYHVVKRQLDELFMSLFMNTKQKGT